MTFRLSNLPTSPEYQRDHRPLALLWVTRRHWTTMQAVVGLLEAVLGDDEVVVPQLWVPCLQHYLQDLRTYTASVARYDATLDLWTMAEREAALGIPRRHARRWATNIRSTAAERPSSPR